MKTFYKNCWTTIYLAIILLLIAWFSSCQSPSIKLKDVDVVYIGKHEYLRNENGQGDIYTHWGDCKACDSIQEARLMKINLSIQRQIAHYFLYDSRTKEVRGGRVYYQVTSYDQNGN